MTERFRAYTNMKDSGANWFGYVPASWGCVPLVAVASPRSVANCPDRELLSVYLNRGVVRFSDVAEKRTNTTSSDLSKYQVVDPGDFVLNNQQAWRGSVGVSPYAGIVSPAYLVLSLSPSLYPQYAHYLFRDKAMVSQYLVCSKGVGSIQRNLYWPHLKRVTTLVPPIDEQKAIARYLHAKDRHITRFIHNRRRLIEVLNEQKQLLTQSAITSSNTNLYRMRDLVTIPKRKVERVENQKYIPIGMYNWGRGIFQKPPTRGQDLGDSTFFWIEEGDLVFSGQFAWEGAVSLAREKDHLCIASHRYPVFISKTASLRTSYLESFFQSSAGHLLMDVNSRGAAGRNRPLNTRTLLMEMIPVPSIDKQLDIEEFSNYLQRVSDNFGRQIDFIHEYRTRLIADVVTGKVDVRHLAPPPSSEDLEEMLDELEPLDDATAELEDEA